MLTKLKKKIVLGESLWIMAYNRRPSNKENLLQAMVGIQLYNE